MNLIGASKIITCDKNFDIIDNGGILFDEGKILKIGDYKTLESKSGTHGTFYDSSVITPAFINPHIHFEFSKNATTLQYGSFGKWLDSVMKNRESLMKDSKESIQAAIKESMRGGVACVGAISSNGLDIDELRYCPLKVVLFNEIMGSNEKFIDAVRADFDARLNKTLELQNERFKAAVALHSPYSLHNELALYAILKAKELKLLVSTHFLESKDELKWLESASGYFREFFKKNFGIDSPKQAHTKDSFLELFKRVEALFVHCLYLNNDDFTKLSKLNIDIVSSPRSNRLLNNKYFDFLKAKDYGFELMIATDGKSSNNTLNILDEARTALFAYEKYNVENLAKEILLSITQRPAKRFKFNNGILQKGKASDFAIFKVPDITISSQVALQFILHAREVSDLYINGKRIDIENY